MSTLYRLAIDCHRFHCHSTIFVPDRGCDLALSLVIYNEKIQYYLAHYISVKHYRHIFLLLCQPKVSNNAPWITTPSWQIPLIKFPTGQLPLGSYPPLPPDNCPWVTPPEWLPPPPPLNGRPIKFPSGQLLRSVSSWVILSLIFTLAKRVLQLGILVERAL